MFLFKMKLLSAAAVTGGLLASTAAWADQPSVYDGLCTLSLSEPAYLGVETGGEQNGWLKYGVTWSATCSASFDVVFACGGGQGHSYLAAGSYSNYEVCRFPPTWSTYSITFGRPGTGIFASRTGPL
ncbi:hypothetical protein POL68_17935 [Stigmatella sp. ncwal1]|uniref:Uncharacterized protein n=1 Tax=Stigmatella ashevillensis TaxID=2995309 RepID=A0ABT5D9L2_9BACT|nr:hypothetical protein [Stigmatella ashevillena]MDC0710362.1 hypothetical protein [Stigmatella ashevillena]